VSALIAIQIAALGSSRPGKPDDDVLTWFGTDPPLHPTITPPFGLSANGFAVLEIVAIVLALGLWVLLLMAVLTWTRPADVDPLPANADFPDDLPPAVVSFLANRWRLNEDAAEATLLDLAARHWIELRQPGNDPTQTTVHMLPTPAGPAGQPLTDYEEQVLRHVRDQAVDDVVPVTALTFRDLGRANIWTHRLHATVIEDARERGLTRRRFSPGLVSLLSGAALLPAGLLALAMLSFRTPDGDVGGNLSLGGFAGLILFTALTGIAGRPRGERDTPLGREVAARWLGLRTFLRNDEAFAELPPAAVAVWDRYLSYGDALGVTRVCSALLDLGMGDRKRVWSSFGGGWHRVRVHYPKFWGRYGATAPRVLIGALATLAMGGLFVKVLGTTGLGFPDSRNHLLGDLPFLLGWYFVIRGLYRLGRLTADLTAPRTISGEVLWIELWKQTQEKEDQPAVPLVHYFAVDDGTGEHVTAWALPSDWSGRAQPGDVVTILVRPWTRRVTELTVDSSRAARLLAASAGTDADADAGARAEPAVGAAAAALAGPLNPVLGKLPPVLGAAVVAAAASGTRAAPGTSGSPSAPAAPGPLAPAAPLITVEEVAAALGRPVVTDAVAGRFTLGPFEMVAFSAPGGGVPVLMLAVARGKAVGLVMRGARGGTKLPGIGDEAWQGPNWVVGRRGQTMLRLNLETGAQTSPQSLPTLLTKALSRLP
jgi:hypothetical protein